MSEQADHGEEPTRARVLAWILVACLVLAGGLIFFFGPSMKETYLKPDSVQMRAYRVSKLSDAQLVALHDKAVQEFEAHKQQQAEEGKKYWAERAERQRTCEANPASKFRNPIGCYEPLPLLHEAIGKPAMGWESPEAFFEDEIMGICKYVDSVRKAKEAGCLAP